MAYRERVQQIEFAAQGMTSDRRALQTLGPRHDRRASRAVWAGLAALLSASGG